MTFRNWPVLLKVLSLPLALGILALFAAVFAAASMKTIDTRYSDIISKSEVANMATARANRLLAAYARDGFRLATALTDREIRTSNAMIADDKAKFNEEFAVAEKADPGRAGDLEHLKQQAHKAMDESCAEMIRLSQSTDPGAIAAATAQMNTVCEPALVVVSDAITAYNQRLDSALQETAAAASRQTGQTRLLTLGSIIGGLAVILAAGLWLNLTGLVRPLKGLTEVMDVMARGRLDVTIANQDRRDEIGAMARTSEAFRKGLAEAERLRHEAERLKADGEAARRQAMLDLADRFEGSIGGIVRQVADAATEMQAAATQLTAAAHEASAQSVAVSAAAEEAGANVTSVASSAEELGASVNEIGRQVETSADIAEDALSRANAAAGVVAELSEVAASIGGVADMIAALAGQTNLLALNATIESARAGEAGKGFAVVASEVKALAGQTSKATTDISAKIAHIQETTGRTVAAMQAVSSTIEAINGSSQAIASAVEQQTSATREIVHAVHQASVGTQEVTSNISGVAQAAEQTGAAAAQVQSASDELARQAERLHLEMDAFLQTVRAA